MARVEITVNGRPYTVGCEDGHEERLRRLALQFDEEVGRLAEKVGQIGDLRLFLLAGLTICDELDETREKQGGGTPASANDPANAERDAAAMLARAAERIEILAARVEQA